jgi:hypothetical protein
MLRFRLVVALCPIRGLAKQSLALGTAVGFIVALDGCSSIEPVAEFGKNASVIAGYPEVAQDYPAILQRQRLYGDKSSAVGDERIAARKRDAQRLRDAQKVLEAYARALGALAANDLITYDREIDGLNRSIVDARLATSAETEVYAKVAKFAFQLGTDIYRRNKIRLLITTYNPAIQKATRNLVTIVESGYLTSLKDERDYFDKYVAGPANLTTESSEGLPEIVRIVARNQGEVLDKKKESAKALAKGMRTFAQGHQELATNINKVSFKETISVARDYAEQLRDILKDLRS